MERYYQALEDSKLYKDWLAYKANEERVRQALKQFLEANGIESESYYIGYDGLYIVPTQNDEEKFGKVLGKPVNDDLRKFNSGSKIGKAWAKTMKDEKLMVPRKPMVISYFLTFGGGKYRSRLFEHDGAVYCSVYPAGDEVPEGLIEIKASEFHRIIEESEKEAG